jgi:hypothetical protein
MSSNKENYDIDAAKENVMYDLDLAKAMDEMYDVAFTLTFWLPNIDTLNVLNRPRTPPAELKYEPVQ